MPRWGMLIDTHKCVGCYSCMVSCKEENFLPPDVFWTRVLIGETGKYPRVTKHIYPVQCNHCEDPPCVPVCPTGATYIRDDGIVSMHYDKCLGCRYCLIACPYQQRTFLKEIKEYYPGQGMTEYEQFGEGRFQKGTVVKCNFCEDRIDAGIEKGMKPGVDRDATPACVISCTANAKVFGDLDDPESKVSRMIAEKKAVQLLPERGTNPRVFYVVR